MDFLSLKLNFISYLETKCNIDVETNATGEAEINIFEYQKEFKKFLKEEYDSEDIVNAIKMIEIEEFDIEDGEFVKQDEENEKENFFIEMLNEFFGQEEVIETADVDKNGKLEAEEIFAFLEEANKMDDRKYKFSFDDLFESMEKIKDDTFKMPEIEKPEETQPTAPSGGGYNPSSGSSGSSGNSKDDQQQTNPLDGMSLKELEAETTTRMENLDLATKNLSAARTGNTDTLKAFEEGTLKPAEQNYLNLLAQDENLNAENKQALQENNENLKAEETNINNLKARIRDYEIKIAVQDSQVQYLATIIEGLEANKSTLGTQLGAAQAALNSATKEGKASAQAKVNQIESKLTEVQQQIDAQTKAKEEKEQLVAQYTEEKTAYEGELGAAESEKADLEAIKAELEAELMQKASPETQAAYQAYQSAKANYETQRTTELTEAENTFAIAGTSYMEVISKTLEVERAENDKKFSLNTNELFKDSELDIKEVTNEHGTYILMSPKDIDSDSNAPLLVYLHGDGETTAGAIKTKGAGKALQESSLTAFNGYILFPITNKKDTSKGRFESKEEADMVKAQMEEIIANYNIDEEKIALAGHSRGAVGVSYMLKQIPDTFKSAAILSGYLRDYIDPKNSDIPIYGFVGTSDDEESKEYMHSAFDSTKLIEVKADHGNVPNEVMALDSDNDGNPDFFEILFNGNL